MWILYFLLWRWQSNWLQDKCLAEESSVQSVENCFCAQKESVGQRAELKGFNKAQSWWQGWGGLILTDWCGDTQWNRTGHCERARTTALCFVTEQCWTLQTHTDGLTESISMGPSTHRTEGIDASSEQRGKQIYPVPWAHWTNCYYHLQKRFSLAANRD